MAATVCGDRYITRSALFRHEIRAAHRHSTLYGPRGRRRFRGASGALKWYAGPAAAAACVGVRYQRSERRQPVVGRPPRPGARRSRHLAAVSRTSRLPGPPGPLSARAARRVPVSKCSEMEEKKILCPVEVGFDLILGYDSFRNQLILC